MIRIGFNLMAVGVLLALIFLPISGYDVLPDILGYLLIACGAAQVRHLASEFRVALTICVPLIPASLSEYFDTNPANGLAFMGTIQSLVTLALFALLWQLASGVRVAAQRNLVAELATRAEAVRWILVYLLAGYVVTLGVSTFSETLTTACAVLTTLILLALAAMMFALLYRAGELLGEPPSDSLPLTVPDPA